MSEPKHTPYRAAGMRFRWNSPSSPEREILDDQNRVVASVPYWSSENTVGRDEDDARIARMISALNACEGLADPETAIPALVEALEKFVDAMKSDQREKCDVALRMARAALALVKP